MSAEQADLVRRLLRSGDLIRPVIGPAGTGKTEAMRAVVHALTAAGYTVYGTANGGRQAEELHDRLQVPAQVVSGWLTRLDHSRDPAQVWRPGTVLILDEATQVSTRDGERLLRYAVRTGTVVILVGDIAQLGSVGAGGWFRHLVRTLAALAEDGVPGLRVNQRQTGPQMRQVRAALAALRRDLPAADHQALRLLAQDGRIRVFDSPADMLLGVVDDWHTERRRAPHPRADATAIPTTTTRGLGAPHSPGPLEDLGLTARSRMMAEHHRDTELLNQAARARLIADGTLAGPSLRVAGRDFQAGDEVITLTQSGHTLVPVGQPTSAYIRTGTIGVVTAVHTNPARPEQQGLTVLFPGRGHVHVGWDYLTHAFPDGRDGGLGHAYALTAHKAEGATMPTARAVVADDTSRPGLYVMLSRAKHDLRAYLIRRPDLEAHLEDEDWLPVLHDGTGPMRRLLDRLAESRPERLASEHDPVAHAAHRLARRHTLAELTQLRRAAIRKPGQPSHQARGRPITPAEDIERPQPAAEPLVGGDVESVAGKEVDLHVARRAELAAETATRHAAIADPPWALIAQIGPRPAAAAARVLWDDAVGSLAVHKARHPAVGVPAHRLPPQPPADSSEPEHRWKVERETATAIATTWAETLGSARARRFLSQQEAVPRERAISGIHALLAIGRTPHQITAALDDDLDDIRTAAAVLDHRVQALLAAAGVDPAAYQLPPPITAHQEWIRTMDLLKTVHARHLATRATADLAAEHRELTRLLDDPLEPARRRSDLVTTVEAARAARDTAQRVHDVVQHRLVELETKRQPDQASLAVVHDRMRQRRQELADSENALEHAETRVRACDGDPEALQKLQDRLLLLERALDHQVDDAATRLAQEPAPYLTAVLGHRPEDPADAAQWNRDAIAIERWRHCVLGLPYGIPAASLTGPPMQAALGPIPEDAGLADEYQRLAARQPTLEFEPAL